MVQQLKETDTFARMEFAATMLHKISESSSFLSSILWSDKAHFTLDGCVFTHQCIIWSQNNPHCVIEKSLHPERVTVWVCFTAEFILPPFFFDGNVNKKSYLDLLQNHVVVELKRRRK